MNIGSKGVSVVICYKNEGKTIATAVKAILTQEYPLFEVIAINDYSTDEGPKLLSEINDGKLVRINCSENYQGKKFALTEAINHSKYDSLLLIDGDCIPNSNKWISHMIASQQEEGCVLGYGPLKVQAGLLGLWQKHETVMTAMQYMSYALYGHAYMGVGRNLLISKKSFLSVAGYESHKHIAAGDDDLLIQSLSANKVPVSLCIHEDAWVYSDAKSNFDSYLFQKLRHTGVANYYQTKFKFFLGLFALAQAMFWLIAILILIISPDTWQSVLMISIFKWICQSILHFRWFLRLDCWPSLYIFPIMDILTPLYYAIIGLKSSAQTAWK